MMRPTRLKTDLKAAEIGRRDRAFQRESVDEKQERAKKTARLRALRLAKEAAEREQAKSQVAEKAAAKVKESAKKARFFKRGPATGDSAAARPNADSAGS